MDYSRHILSIFPFKLIACQDTLIVPSSQLLSMRCFVCFEVGWQPPQVSFATHKETGDPRLWTVDRWRVFPYNSP